MDNLTEILKYIPPDSCNYTEWVNVGMALKFEGYSCNVWEDWSSLDSRRFHPGECAEKWESFKGSSTPVTAGTVVQMAKERGYKPIYHGDEPLDFDSVICEDNEKFIDIGYIDSEGELPVPHDKTPVEQLITYLETLFNSDENVGYVTKSYESKNKDGKYVPTKGHWDRTAGQLIDELSKSNGDIGAVLGDYNKQVGAWIRFNPLDGNGIKNENVSDFRYALVESDNISLTQQYELIKRLELPVAAIVYSGSKSVHAIIKINAPDFTEYRKRVDFLYKICAKNGLTVDTQNKNPSRLSRMPGVKRGENMQYLLDTNIGKASWDDWKEFIDGITDDLPDFENLSDYENNLPELSPPLIENVLRQGHKMLLAGPSKAGKSFALIELCISIAEGRRWLGYKCAKGKVLYVNLELDKPSCIHRFFDAYKAMGLSRNYIKNIKIWNLRGQSVPMDQLAPMLIRRAAKQNFIAVIIDPIYKVITGDENSADQMAKFCNQFDKICAQLGCSVIYCHHHSKGAQGDKRSMDRASGSGVFARDPDALLDLIELEITDSLRSQEENKAICKTCTDVLTASGIDVDEEVSQDDMCSSTAMQKHCKRLLTDDCYNLLLNDIEDVKRTVAAFTAWRIEGTFREFPKSPPLNVWFKYPIHEVDNIGCLKDVEPVGEQTWRSNFQKSGKRSKTDEQRKEERIQTIETAFENCKNDSGEASIKDLAEYTGFSEKTICRRLKEHGGFWIEDKKTGRKKG